MWYYNMAGDRYPLPERRLEPPDFYGRRRRPGRVCPECGSRLDAGERCDCEDWDDEDDTRGD